MTLQAQTPSSRGQKLLTRKPKESRFVLGLTPSEALTAIRLLSILEAHPQATLKNFEVRLDRVMPGPHEEYLRMQTAQAEKELADTIQMQQTLGGRMGGRR